MQMKSIVILREGFVNRMLRELSESNKKVLDTLIDSKRLFKKQKRFETCPINDEVIMYVSLFLGYNYEEAKKKLAGQAELFNSENMQGGKEEMSPLFRRKL